MTASSARLASVGSIEGMPSLKVIVAVVRGRLAATMRCILSRAASSCARVRKRRSPSTTAERGTTLVLPVACPVNVAWS